jgi:hypothetical protein
MHRYGPPYDHPPASTMSKNRDDRPLSSDELIRRARMGMTDPVESAPADESSLLAGSDELLEDASFVDLEPYPPRADPSEADADPSSSAGEFGEAQDPSPAPPPPPVDGYLTSGTPAEPTIRPMPGTDLGLPGQTPGPGGWRPTPRPESQNPSTFSKFWRKGRWVIGAVVLLAAFGDRSQKETSVENVEVGDCFEDPGVKTEFESVTAVDCDELHAFELFATVELGPPGRAYPGNDALLIEVDKECYKMFPQYVGIDFEKSAYAFAGLTPAERSWIDFDDHTGWCVVFEFNRTGTEIEPAKGTARNARR